MKGCQPTRRHNQATITGVREVSNIALDLSGVAHTDRDDLDPERWSHRLNHSKLTDPWSNAGAPQHRRSRDGRCHLLGEGKPDVVKDVEELHHERVRAEGAR